MQPGKLSNIVCKHETMEGDKLFAVVKAKNKMKKIKVIKNFCSTFVADNGQGM